MTLNKTTQELRVFALSFYSQYVNPLGLYGLVGANL